MMVKMIQALIFMLKVQLYCLICALFCVVPFKSINFQYDCAASFDLSKFLYTLDLKWSLTNDDCLAFAALDHFNVSLYSDGNNLVHSTVVQPQKVWKLTF